MANLNKVFLVGNLTRDPEVKYLPSGTAVADLGLAVNETYKNRDGETKESTVFVDVAVWARQAETCGEYLTKGSPVLIEGRLQLDQWETQQGEKRSKLRVRADRVQFLGRPRNAASGDGPPDRGEFDGGPARGAGSGDGGVDDEDDLPF
jgi:single-strand DNA-binding protein